MNEYEMMELEFHGDAPDGSYVTVDLTGTFIKDDKSIYVKGFYAGNGIYKIRFLPMEAGIYRYRVEGIIHEEGTLEVKSARDFLHGPVRASGTHLEYADGTYFYSFGTTVYALAHQDSVITEETFKTLQTAPFNKIRIWLYPKHYPYNHNDSKYFPFETFSDKTYTGAKLKKSQTNDKESMEVQNIWDVNHPCFEFWDAFEEKLIRLGNMGIQVDLILFHPYDQLGLSKLSQQDNLVYLDYAIRRLSAIPHIWWSMANEYDLFAERTQEDWQEIEAYIAENDVFHHLLSNHNYYPMYDFSHKAITHCSIQKHVMNLAYELQTRYHKPVCYDECGYEGNLKETWGSLSGKEMVNRFWKAAVTGAYCTHGEVLLGLDEENVDDAIVWFTKGGKLHGESTSRIAFLRKIIEDIGAPLTPKVTGIGNLLDVPEEIQLQVLKYLPTEVQSVFRYIKQMDIVELKRQMDAEYEYIGVSEDQNVLLYYYGTDCHMRVEIELPQERKYRVEIIDAWNMTRETVATGLCGKHRINLPGKEYMAVLATAEET